MSAQRHLTQSSLLLIALVPAVYLGHLILLHGRNVPISDAWPVYLAPFLNNDLGDLSWSAFWRTTNAGIHRKLLPMLLGATVLKLTHFNLVALTVVNLFISLMNCLLLFKLYTNTENTDRTWRALPLITFSLLSIAIFPFWLQPLMIEGNLAISGLLWSLYFLTRPGHSWFHLCAAILAAVVSSFSFFPGNVTWLVAPLVFATHQYHRLRYYVAWAIAAAAVLIPFTIQYAGNKHAAALSAATPPSLLAILSFICGFVGSMMRFAWQGRAMLFGLLGLSLFSILIACHTRHAAPGIRRVSPFVAIVLWIVINAAFAAYGRASSEFAAVRYVMYSVLFWSIITIVAFMLCAEPGRGFMSARAVGLGTLGIVGALHSAAVVQMHRSSHILDSARVWARSYSCLDTYLVDAACLSRQHSDRYGGRSLPSRMVIGVGVSGIARAIEAGIYPRPSEDLPLAFSVPRSKIHKEVTKEHEVTWVQAPDSSVRWSVSFPRLQSRLYRDFPLEGICLTVGIPGLVHSAADGGEPDSAGHLLPRQTVGVYTGGELVRQFEIEPAPYSMMLDLSGYQNQTVELEFKVAGADFGRWLPPRITYDGCGPSRVDGVDFQRVDVATEAAELGPVPFTVTGFMGRPRTGDRPPHIILISSDALRADHLSLHGYPRRTSPAIDAFAREALSFSQAITVIPKTLPSFTSLFSGLHPQQHGVEHNYFKVPEELPLLAEQLKRRGYRTAAFVSNPVMAEDRGLTRGFDRYEVFWGGQGSSQRANRAFLSWAEEGGEKGWESPTFVWVHYLEPHGPYRPPPDLVDLFAGDELDQDDRRVALDVKPLDGFGDNKVLGGVPLYQRLGDEDRVAHYVRQYDAEIRHVDLLFQELRDFLRARDLYGESWVVFLSDHGESLGEHDYYFEHGWFAYDATLRVPLLVKPPGEPSGAVIDRQVTLLDLAPMLLSAAGLEADPALWGRNPLVDEADDSRPALIQSAGNYPRQYFGVRTSRYKYLRDEADGSEELYDLRADPGETANLVAERPDEVRELRRLLHRLLREARSTRLPNAAAAPPAGELRERLKALGYVGE